MRHFVVRFSAEEGKKVAGVERSALEMLQRFPWPGNVRQLENAIFRAVVLTDHALLTVDDFPQLSHFAQRLDPGAPRADVGPRPAAAAAEHAPSHAPSHASVPSEPDSAWIPAPPAASSMGGAKPVSAANAQGRDRSLGITATLTDGHLRTLQDIESEVIRLALEHYRGHMSEVARRLGIGRSTLYRKVRELGLDKDIAEG